MPEDRHSNGRLDSWKEIAAYLNRDVRTVIRWERKGLPVHRVPGGKRQAVFAYPAEIEAWLSGPENFARPPESNGSHTEPHSNGSVPSPASNGIEHRRNEHSGAFEVPQVADTASSTNTVPQQQNNFSRQGTGRIGRYGWRLALAAAGLLGLIGIVGTVFRPSPTYATLRPFSLRQLTDNGWPKFNIRTDGTMLYFNQIEGARSLLFSASVSGHVMQPIETPFSNVALQDVSKNGKTLLISSYDGILIEGPLWTLPVQGGTPHRIGEAECQFARWSPDNRKIACAVGTAITLMDSDGSNVRTIESSSSPAGPVSWNPDGSSLRYVLQTPIVGFFSQWEMQITPDGSAGPAHKLNLGPNCCFDWTWTGDGRAFVHTDYVVNGKGRLVLEPDDSGHSIELPLKMGALFGVSSAATGDGLYLDIGSAFRGELLKFDSRQNALQTFLPGVSATFVAFSPDGKWITYSNTQDYSLWRSRADGSDALQLTKPPMQVQVSAWSPDGREIAFMEQAPGKPWRIYLIGRDGGGPVREVSDGNDNQGGPSFSPDGNAIVYGNVFCEETQNCWIRRVDLATHKSEIIPGSNGLRTARWSPDGKYIAALRFRTRELVLFDFRTQRWRVLTGSVAGDNVNWSSDSHYVYVDNPRDENPAIEKVRVADGRRTTVVSLASLQKVPGTTDTWFGLTPDDSPLLCHMFNTSEIYALNWTDR
jgi:Tol biopolymer transport system component